MTRRSVLRELGIGARLGISLLVLTLLGGLTVSGWYMAMHHENRDEQPGLTMTDIRGHYAGVNVRSPLLAALENGHPPEQSGKSRRALIDWLSGDNISDDYDNIDLGEYAPAEIIAVDCLSCHSRQSTGPEAYPQLPLDYWDDVRTVAFSRDIRPVDVQVLAASTHAHAISLAILALAAAGLLLMTAWPRAVAGTLVFLMGIGLAVDLSGWWLARHVDAIVPMIVAGGFVFSAAVGVSLLLVLLDLWRPYRQRSSEPSSPD